MKKEGYSLYGSENFGKLELDLIQSFTGEVNQG